MICFLNECYNSVHVYTQFMYCVQSYSITLKDWSSEVLEHLMEQPALL